jgi:phosphotransferase system enzyme I (PtsI)
MRVLLPMVSHVEEVQRSRSILNEVADDLRARGLPFDEALPLGAMIEVPAAAMATRSFARHCDFLSVGTNDLSQYALAVDRNNARVAALYQPLHPGLIAILRTVLAEAAEADTPVCLCGELAGEPEATMLLLGLGLRSFSMSSFHVPVVKRLIRSVTLEDARRAAQAVLELGSTSEIRAELRRRTLEHAPEFASLFGRTR